MNQATVGIIAYILDVTLSDMDENKFQDALEEALAKAAMDERDVDTSEMTGEALLQHPAVRQVIAKHLESIAGSVELFCEV